MKNNLKTTIIMMITIFGLTATAKDLQIEPSGYIYAEVTLANGKSYEGVLRWGTEEAFWDDHFNSSKGEIAYKKYAPEKTKRKKDFKILGYTVSTSTESVTLRRLFTANFGDISELEITDDDAARVTMKNGSTYNVEGYANDVGTKITVVDRGFGQIELEWNAIDRIRFKSTPKDFDVDNRRLYGRVETHDGPFVGFIQWDKQECLSSDKLDGKTSDGKVSISMGNIKRIERDGRSAAIVSLADGRELRMRGTNDVNHENRGICVTTQEFGRVEIPWDAFVAVDFEATDSTGRSYDEFTAKPSIYGTIHTTDKRRLEGQLVYDLDEKESWEFINGTHRDVEYNVPFSLVSAIEPIDKDRARISLRNGRDIELEGQADVNELNLGFLIFEGDENNPVVLRWGEVRRIELR